MYQFGEFLSNLRNSKGFTLEELAPLVGTSKSTLSRLENNEIPRPFKGSVRKLIFDLARTLCDSKKETERYLTLAGIDIALLTEHEEILLFAPRIAASAQAGSGRDGILVLNFAHPLTEQQRAQIEELAGATIEDVITVPTLVNEEEPLGPQITGLVEAIGLSSDDWRRRNILINPPGYTPAATLLLAEIHGRSGHFPTLIRMRPKHGSVTYYEVVELLNLQTVRDAARTSSDTSMMHENHAIKSLT